MPFLSRKTNRFLCFGCGKPQPSRGYITCPECFHTYRTRWHLLVAYWKIVFQMDGLACIIRCRRFRPSKIYFCQCCIHDF